MQGFRDIAALFRQLGPLWFTIIFGGFAAALIGYGIVFAMLADRIGWREAYGFSCRRRCLFVDMWHSRKLLEGGTGAELTLFAMIWFVPVMVTLIGVFFAAKRSLARHRDRIRPLDGT